MKCLHTYTNLDAQTFKTLGDPADSKLYPRLKSIYESKERRHRVVKTESEALAPSPHAAAEYRMQPGAWHLV